MSMLFSGSSLSEPSSCQVVGHEDVVPVLEVAIGVVAGPVVGAAELRAAVEVHLRAGPAGAGVARLPEVLRARQRHDALLGDADRAPDLDRLRRPGPRPSSSSPSKTVTQISSGSKPKPSVESSQPQAIDSLLEVVAEAPVAEHLEEGQVAGGVADLLDVGRAEAALARRSSRGRGRLLLALEVRLERLHPGGREQHRRVIGRRGPARPRARAMAPLLEEREVGLADLVDLHATQSRNATVRSLG